MIDDVTDGDGVIVDVWVGVLVGVEPGVSDGVTVCV